MKVEFPDLNPSIWTLQRKLFEHEHCYDEEESAQLETAPTARAVFTCIAHGKEEPQEAVLKMFMQIPWIDTETSPIDERSAQAYGNISDEAEYEAEALKTLTDAQCSSTPKLLAVKHTTQSNSMPAPGGFISFILMEKLSGERIERIEDLHLSERETLRQSFKESWLEAHVVGISPGDEGIRNLIWDRKIGKCYIVDFGVWFTAEELPWYDGLFKCWNLMLAPASGVWLP